ncbi:hypothetical protein EUGRSUZ_F01518 [Eucalyptus grandis]|uniref:Uncharacterized protein n=1 Tax=Eucalyptus grandis TaxID=71139 RepID=A0ACC3KES6_EUCGR|nr:hypothetical protein EUGRSUZ_F01518 [Eucalyptus grandis]
MGVPIAIIWLQSPHRCRAEILEGFACPTVVPVGYGNHPVYTSSFDRCMRHNISLFNPNLPAGVPLLEIVPPSCPHPSVSSGDIVMGIYSVYASSFDHLVIHRPIN